MNILEKAEENKNKKKKDKLPFAVFICPKSNVGELEDYKQVFTDIIFICPKSNVGELEDYKQVFTDIISDRIKQKYK